MMKLILFINLQVVDPPSYQTFWITDLPPSYSAVIRTQPPNSLPNYHLTSVDEFAIGPRLSNPPPYTMAMQSDVLNATNGQATNRTLEPHLQSFQGINQARVEPWPLETGHHIVRRQSFSEIPHDNEDKEPKERRRSRSTGNRYLNNIINCTLSRNERRANDDRGDHQNTPTIEQRIDSSQIHSGNNNINNNDSKVNFIFN